MNEVKVEFKCHKCVEEQNFSGTLEELLLGIRDSGFPICPKCGDDMEVIVNSVTIYTQRTKWKHLER